MLIRTIFVCRGRQQRPDHVERYAWYCSQSNQRLPCFPSSSYRWVDRRSGFQVQMSHTQINRYYNIQTRRTRPTVVRMSRQIDGYSRYHFNQKMLAQSWISWRPNPVSVCGTSNRVLQKPVTMNTYNTSKTVLYPLSIHGLVTIETNFLKIKL